MSAARRTRRARPAPPAPNPAGAHALADHVARRLVRNAEIRAGELVLDIGAGLGAMTQPLADTGGRIIAIERDERLAGKLARRMAAYPNVTVVTGDALCVPLPRRPYRVVANIPFGITTALLLRLVDSRLVTADLVVALGAGRMLAASPPVRRELARWHRWFDFSLGPVIPAHQFRPAPPLPAVILRLSASRLSPPVRSASASRLSPPVRSASASRTRQSGRGRR